MKRVFWLGVGMATGLALGRKLNRTAYRLTPAGMAENVGDALRELAVAVGSFGADVRAGMTEREDELRTVVTERAGLVVRSDLDSGRHARRSAEDSGRYRPVEIRTADGYRAKARRDARAPRADG
jgi:chromosome condensin MukBEF MukE localization factor